MFLLNFIFFLSGFIFIYFGYMIWRYKKLWLIAGYNEKRVADKEGLARFTGFYLFLMSFIIIVISIIGMIFDINTTIPYTIAVVIISIRMAFGHRKYERKS
ncbi:DUF3784 domain-containing protein [Caloranaerobacter ferrireducens]|uniref:DUF3784 domain-containing protein n=1 Tax=Caloranaerobacter ferrireducens TaxID=1323370 RepID=UPI00084DDDF2|nr:DUF3784 domain-containing protein [Caloranaerobacter ferrireducens]